jgi:hypothetical protein
MPRIQDVVRPRPEAVGEPATARRQLCCACRHTPIIVAPYDAAPVSDDLLWMSTHSSLTGSLAVRAA